MQFLEIKLKLKIKLRSYKSSEHINEKRNGPYRGFGYLSLGFGKMEPKRNTVFFATSNRIVDTKASIIQKEPNI